MVRQAGRNAGAGIKVKGTIIPFEMRRVIGEIFTQFLGGKMFKQRFCQLVCVAHRMTT